MLRVRQLILRSGARRGCLRWVAPGLAVLSLAGTSEAFAAGGASPGGTSASKHRGAASGGAGVAGARGPRSTAAHPIVNGYKAKIVHGVAYAPSMAPMAVKRAIWAGNKIRTKPYIYGGGHGSFNDSGYDCSGSVSYVLHGGGLLSVPMDSSELMSWGNGGRGHWMTVYTNPGHAFIEIAGIRFDTSSAGDPHPAPGSGPRWRPLLGDTSGFSARHPTGY